jgi:hypothetical protein
MKEIFSRASVRRRMATRRFSLFLPGRGPRSVGLRYPHAVPVYAACILFKSPMSRDCRAFHKSYWSWSRSQPSGERPKTFDNLSAISGLMPERPFKSAENVFLATPSALAASVTVTSSGSMQNSLMISPGCGGLCMAISYLLNDNPHNVRPGCNLIRNRCQEC